MNDTRLHEKRIGRRLVVVASLLAITVGAAACGTVASSAPKAPPTVARPSLSILKHLMSKNQKIVRTINLKFKGYNPEELVVTTTPTGHSPVITANLNASAVVWNQKNHHWHVIWRSPALTVQESYPSESPTIPAISSWAIHQTSHGALIGLLVPSSIGASTIWNDGMIIWARPATSPHLLWSARGQYDKLADGALSKTTDGILINQDACGAIQATQHNEHAQMAKISCTEITAQTPGKRLRFSTGPKGNHLTVATASIVVKKGSTLVFWPENTATAKLVNNGSLGLYGGYFGASLPNGEVPLASADTLTRWSYKFTTVGTYSFAIVPSSSSAFDVPPDITVQVTN